MHTSKAFDKHGKIAIGQYSKKSDGLDILGNGIYGNMS
jgi:hypothetical protein